MIILKESLIRFIYLTFSHNIRSIFGTCLPIFNVAMSTDYIQYFVYESVDKYNHSKGKSSEDKAGTSRNLKGHCT